MPSLITCIIAKRLTRNASETGDALRLRDKAVGLVARVVRDFGDLYPTLRPRVTRTLMRALLDFSLPAGTHYGAIRGLSLLGNEVRKIVLVPNARLFMDLVAAREREQAKMSDDCSAASAEPVASSEEELTACREAYMVYAFPFRALRNRRYLTNRKTGWRGGPVRLHARRRARERELCGHGRGLWRGGAHAPDRVEARPARRVAEYGLVYKSVKHAVCGFRLRQKREAPMDSFVLTLSLFRI
jgi:hypothetical protein